MSALSGSTVRQARTRKARRTIRRSAAGMAPALVVVLLSSATPAGAGSTSVTISAATQSGSTLIVSGAADLSDQPFMTLGTDPADDIGLEQGREFGADLTGALAATKRSGHVTLRWVPKPSVIGDALPGILYKWSFCVDGAWCWRVFAQRGDMGAPSLDGHGVLRRCETQGCQEATVVRWGIPVSFDEDAKTLTATLELPWIDAEPGSTLVPLDHQAWPGAVDTGYGSCNDPIDRSCIWNNMGDGILEIDPYQVPIEEVALAVAVPGQDPAGVAYGVTVNPAPDGEFTGSLNVGGLEPGTYEVYARACFGTNNCAYATAPIEL